MVNPYLDGNFAPVRDELTVVDLQVTGRIPDYLNGRFLRNGPNPVAEVDPEIYHWFTGDGMVHGVRLRDGRADWYRNRWVRSPSVRRALGEDISAGRSSTAPITSIGANTNVIEHAGRTLALVEAGAPGRTEQAEPSVTPAATPVRTESPLNQVLESPAALGGFVVVSCALAAAVWCRPIRPVLAVVAVFALVAAVFDTRELGHQLTVAHPGLAALTGLIAVTRLAVLAGTAQLWRAR